MGLLSLVETEALNLVLLKAPQHSQGHSHFVSLEDADLVQNSPFQVFDAFDHIQVIQHTASVYGEQPTQQEILSLMLLDFLKGLSFLVPEFLLHIGEKVFEVLFHSLKVTVLDPENQLSEELSVVALLLVVEDQVQRVE